MNYDEMFEKLNEYQKKAVMSIDKAALLDAAVGSGKTTVIVHKVLYLNIVKKVPLSGMVVLTFTNKAADEIKDRIKDISPDSEGDMIYFGTFHSVARKILNSCGNIESFGYKNDFEVIDNNESYEILREIVEKENYDIKYKNKLKKRIDGIKDGRTLYGVMKKQDDIKKLYDSYTSEKIKRNVMDFDDLINNSIRILDNPINPEWIIVDEFQDTDEKQLKLLEKISGDRTHIFAVGDPNQIIYSWRTGNFKVFDKFIEDFNPQKYTLPVNYRSSRTIVEAAESFIGNSKIVGVRGYGNPIIIRKNYDSFNEALHFARKIKEFNGKGIAYNEIAVLFRRKQQGDIISDVFKRENIPFRIVVKSNIDEYKECSENDEKVSLLTLHGAKGLEFSNVFIAGVNMGNIPLTTRRNEEDEEARLFFVGITRAKNYLEISYVSKPGIPGETKYPSPYISMLPKELVKHEDEGESVNLKDLVNEIRSEREKKKSRTCQKENHPSQVWRRHGCI